MEKFFLLLFGTNDYLLVIVGFLWACFGAFVSNAIRGHKPSPKTISIKIMSIIVALRCVELFTGSQELTVQVAALIGLSIDGIVYKIKEMSKKPNE